MERQKKMSELKNSGVSESCVRFQTMVILFESLELAVPLQTTLCENPGQQEAWWVSLGSSACMIESLGWVLCAYPITQAGRKFKGKYIFYAEQSKSILSLSQLLAPVSIKCLIRYLRGGGFWEMWSLKGTQGWCQASRDQPLCLAGTALCWGCAWWVLNKPRKLRKSGHCTGTPRLTFEWGPSYLCPRCLQTSPQTAYRSKAALASEILSNMSCPEQTALFRCFAFLLAF